MEQSLIFKLHHVSNQHILHWPVKEERIIQNYNESGRIFLTSSKRIGITLFIGINILEFYSQPLEFMMHQDDLDTVGSRFDGIIVKFEVLLQIEKQKEATFYIKVNNVEIKFNTNFNNDLPSINIDVNEFVLMPNPRYVLIEKKDVDKSIEYLFIRYIQELEQRIFNSDDYDIIRASGIIRFLIAETKPDDLKPGESYGLQIAAKYKIPLNFSIVDESTLSLSMDSYTASNILYSDRYPYYKTKKIDIDTFLKTPVIIQKHDGINKDNSTVYIIIKTMAEVKGGVHFGPPKAQKVEKNRFIEFINMHSNKDLLALSIIRQIGLITLEAFKPVVDHILQMKPEEHV